MPRNHEEITGIVGIEKRKVRIITGTNNEDGTINLIVAKKDLDDRWIYTDVEVFDFKTSTLKDVASTGEASLDNKSKIMGRGKNGSENIVEVHFLDSAVEDEQGLLLVLPSLISVGLPAKPLLMAIEKLEA